MAEARFRLQARYGDRLAHVVLYGSHARGEADADSDVEVLVERKRLTRLMPEFLRRYDEDFSFHPVSEEACLDRNRSLMTNVHAKGLER